MRILGRLGRGTLRAILILLAIVVALEVVYLVVGNILLRGDFVTSRVNKHPEKILVSYDSAYTLFPGHASVRGLRIRNQASRSQLEVAVDEVSAVLNPLPLAWKTINIVRASARGAEFRMRSRPHTVEEMRDKAAAMPPIEGLDWENSVRDPNAVPKPPKWGFSVTSARVEDTRQVWINEFRVDGPGRAGGGVSVGPGRRLAISGAWVEFPGLTASLAGTVFMSGGELKGELDVESYDYGEHKGLGFLPYAAADVALRGVTGTKMALLNYIFRNVPWLEFSGDPNEQELRVVLEKGKLQPGTHAHLATDRLHVRLLAYQAEGAADTKIEVVEGGRAKVEVQLTDYRFGLAKYGADGARGDSLRLKADMAADIAFDGTPDMEVDVLVDNLRMDDLGRVNYLIPEGAKLKVTEGKVRVDASMKLATLGSDGSGKVTVDTSGMKLEAGGTRLEGHVSATIPVSRIDLQRGSFALDGTTIRLDEFSLLSVPAESDGKSAPSEETTDWWAQIDVPKGGVDFRKEVSVGGDVVLKMRDTDPLIHFFTASKPLPKIGERILEVENVTGSAGVDYTGDRLAVRNAIVTGDNLEVQAHLELVGKSVEGDLLAVYEFVGVGVELQGDRRKLHLLGARKWYQSQVPGAHPKPSGSEDAASDTPEEKPQQEPSGKEKKKGWFSRTFSSK